MIPANEDAQAQQEQRERILEDLKRRAIPALGEPELERWVDDSVSILALWGMQDGITVDAIKSGAVQEASILTSLWQLIERVQLANTPELQQLALSAGDRLMTVGKYGEAAVGALQADAIESFRSAARSKFPALPGPSVDAVTMTLATMMLARNSVLQKEEIGRLRAEIIAAGGDPDVG